MHDFKHIFPKFFPGNTPGPPLQEGATPSRTVRYMNLDLNDTITLHWFKVTPSSWLDVGEYLRISLKCTGMLLVDERCAQTSLALINDVKRYCMLRPEPPWSFYKRKRHRYFTAKHAPPINLYYSHHYVENALLLIGRERFRFQI